MVTTRGLRWMFGLGLIGSLFLFSGCGSPSATDAEASKMMVAVTIPPQKAFVEAVCGDSAEVIVLVPPGNSPGNYEPTPQEMASFSKAAVYFTIGVPTEKANILPKAGDVNIVDLAAEVSKVYPDLEFSPGNRDPHIWLSPKRVNVMIDAIESAMSTLDPKNAAMFSQNADQFIRQLKAADEHIQGELQGAQRSTFIAFHPSCGYFADEYGLEMLSLEEDGKEATPQHLQDMIDRAKQEGIKVVFSQAEIDSKQPDVFAEEIGGKKIMLEPLSSDYIANLEAMGQAIGEALR